MDRYAIVQDGIVERVTVWDGVAPFDPCHSSDRVVACDATVSAGWSIVDGVFVAPIVPSTEEVLVPPKD